MTKQVEGLEADQVADKDFTFNYTCGEKTGTLVARAGKTVASPKFAVGTTCTVTEDADSAKVDGYVVNIEPSAKEITVAADGSDDVTVTNTYDRELATGSSASVIPWLIPILGIGIVGSVLFPHAKVTGTENVVTSPVPEPQATQTAVPTTETAVPEQNQPQRGVLAQTGANVIGLGLVGLLMLLLGGFLIARRRN